MIENRLCHERETLDVRWRIRTDIKGERRNLICFIIEYVIHKLLIIDIYILLLGLKLYDI